MMHIFKFCLVALAACLFAIACGQAASTPNTAGNANAAANGNKASAATPAAAATPSETASGSDLYARNCMTCHKDSGKGGKVTIEGKTIDPDDITTAKQKAKSDEKITEYINEGFPDDGMPAFKEKLNPDQVKAIVKHVRVLQGGSVLN